MPSDACGKTGCLPDRAEKGKREVWLKFGLKAINKKYEGNDYGRVITTLPFDIRPYFQIT